MAYLAGENMKLGTELRRLRKQRQLTLAEVGEASGLSVSFLSDIERGRTRPSLDTLEKLAYVYQVSINDILKETDLGIGPESTVYPPEYEEFLNKIGGEIDEEIEDILLRVERRAQKRAQTSEDWLQLYYSLKTILRES
jgi:transcriptional regulator with XRE-family HTH domain